MRSHKRDIFLSNYSNKHNFILIRAEKFSSCGFFLHHAYADADLLIVNIALNCAMSRTTVLIGDDTDLLILLCVTIIVNLHSVVYLKTEPQNDSSKLRIWNINWTQTKLGIEICSILVLHAILGCFWEVRERYGIKKMASDNNFAT